MNSNTGTRRAPWRRNRREAGWPASRSCRTTRDGGRQGRNTPRTMRYGCRAPWTRAGRRGRPGTIDGVRRSVEQGAMRLWQGRQEQGIGRNPSWTTAGDGRTDGSARRWPELESPAARKQAGVWASWGGNVGELDAVCLKRERSRAPASRGEEARARHRGSARAPATMEASAVG